MTPEMAQILSSLPLQTILIMAIGKLYIDLTAALKTAAVDRAAMMAQIDALDKRLLALEIRLTPPRTPAL